MKVNRPGIARFARENGVDLMYLFGSAARGDMRPGSDVDIAVSSYKPLTLERRARLSRDLRRVFDFGSADIDLVDLRHVTPELGMQIVTDGKKFYGADKADDAFYRLALKRYIDANKIRAADREDLKTYAAI